MSNLYTSKSLIDIKRRLKLVESTLSADDTEKASIKEENEKENEEKATRAPAKALTFPITKDYAEKLNASHPGTYRTVFSVYVSGSSANEGRFSFIGRAIDVLEKLAPELFKDLEIHITKAESSMTDYDADDVDIYLEGGYGSLLFLYYEFNKTIYNPERTKSECIKLKAELDKSRPAY